MTSEEALAAAYMRVFAPGFPEGQLVLNDLLSESGVLDAGPPSSEADTVWRDGRRSMGVLLLRRLAVSPAEMALWTRRRALQALHGANV